MGRDHHSSTGKFAVVEGKKQAAPPVEFLLVVEAHRKRAPIKPRQTKKNRKQISELPQTLEAPMTKCRNIRRKPHTQQVCVVKHSAPMSEAQNITRLRTSRQ